MLDTSNLHNVICQVYLNKTGGKKLANKIQKLPKTTYH